MVGKVGHWARLLLAFAWGAAACSGRTASNQAQAEAGASSVAGKPSGNSKAGDGAGGSVSAGGSGLSGGSPASGGVVATGGSPNGGVATAGAPSAAGEAGADTSGAGSAGSGGSVALPDPNDILKVKPSLGCGKAPTQATGEFVKFTIQTSGTKELNCADKLGGQPKCGAWSIPRDYYVWLPPNYDKTHAYPLVLQGPGCGGNGTNVYPLSSSNAGAGIGVDGTVIRIGLTPPPNSIGHGTNENQGCFDDKEGDDSVDFVFYETLIDKLKTELCYDENRVFTNGNSSGAWLANELGCKYAGNTEGYAVRGVAVNTGGLPTEPQFVPTCTKAPMAGLWIWETGDLSFPPNKVAVDRAMKVNGCTGPNYDTVVAQNLLVDFPIGGGKPDSTCKKIPGCAPQSPLVVCALAGSGHGGHDDVANPAFATFFSSLEAP